MKIIKLTEEKFWILLICAVIFGLLTPALGKLLSFLVIPLLMTIFFFTYLKTDFLEIFAHIKKPLFLSYILFLFLLVIPACLYGFFLILNRDLAVGILLLCSMPPAIATPVLTDIVKGNTSLTIAISLLAYLITPFTILLLFFTLTQKTVSLNLAELAKTLLLVNFAPLIAAQITRKIKKTLITKTQPYYSVINIFLITFIAYTVIAVQSNKILQQPLTTITSILWLYLVFLLLHVIGYLAAFKRTKKDKIALSVSKAYMNNALAIGLAFTFFNPQVALLMVLSEIPWNTTLGIFKFILKYIK